MKGEGVGHGEGEYIEVRTEDIPDFLDKGRIHPIGDDAFFSGPPDPLVQGRLLNHFIQGPHSLGHDRVIVDPGDGGQQIESAHLFRDVQDGPLADGPEPDKPLAMTEVSACQDHNRGMVLPADIRGKAAKIHHLLMVPRLQNRDHAALEKITGIDHMLGGTGGEITGNEVDEGAPLFIKKGGACKYIPCLKKARYLHGDDRVRSGQCMPEGDPCRHGLVYGPPDRDHVLHTGKTPVYHFRARGSRVPVRAMDAGAHTSCGKGYISLKHDRFSSFSET